MSYDAGIRCTHCGSEVEEIGNITSNVHRMWAVVLPGPFEGGGRYDGTGESNPRSGLPGLSGLPVEVAAPILRAASIKMTEREEELRKLEPANGWGSFQGARSFLRKCADACEDSEPGLVFAVNW